MANDGIIVGIGGDTSGLQQSLNRALNHVGKLAASLAGLVSVAGTFAGMKNALELGSEMTDLSNRTGVAVESLYGLRQGFKDAGVDAQALGPAINKMQKALASAGAGGKEGNVLRGLGLDPQSLASMDSGQAFAKIGNAIAQLPNSTERAAAAMALFGKNGGELLQVFMDPNFKDAGNISNTARLLGENAGIFDKASDSLGHIGPKLQGFFVGFESGMTGLLDVIAEGINSVDLSGIGQSLGTIAGNFSTDFSDEWGKVMQFVSDAIGLVFSKEGLSAIMDSFVYIGDQIRDVLIKAFKTPLDYLEAGLQKAMESAMEMAGKVPVLGEQMGLKGFKASSMDSILGEVRARGNGLTNLAAEDSANKAALGSGLKDRLGDLADKLKESLAPVMTATDATKAANARATAANANRINRQGAFNAAEIGMDNKQPTIADSLQKVGGGGGFVHSDALLDVNREQLNVQKQMVALLQQSQKSYASFSIA